MMVDWQTAYFVVKCRINVCNRRKMHFSHEAAAVSAAWASRAITVAVMSLD
jgi:hypothetical protein